MTLPAVYASTNRSCTATLDADDHFTPWVYVHGNQQLDVIINATDGTLSGGTIKLQRDRDGTNTDWVSDDLGVDYAWVDVDATPVLRMATATRYRLYMTAVTSGEAAVELRAGNRE